MKRAVLLRQIASAAKSRGIGWDRVSSKGSHDKWRLGEAVQVSIPRHTEINEITAQAILKSTESELGERWWR
jgi:predicted RNA binding protein YcfA (HicA-like mRNA interferase family)